MQVGTRLGAYEVIAKLGEGGMGEVWRAHDDRLGRDVAIKVLPAAFAQDPERLARFEREARTLARLNHPNIATVHGLEKDGGVNALVMELVEGPTLADRLAAGRIPPDEALPIAKQIAQALDAAHEQGIVHRDLKPANIKVRLDGTVKVLDFGLAKALTAPEPAASSATITSPALMTAAGVLLGTAAYMSPEQARGRPVDKRTDIWAFGAVLYEMLTGRRAFPGDDVTDAVASVVAREPDWTLLPPGIGGLRACIVRCLQKDPRQRMRDIGDVLLALDGAFESAAAELAPRSGPPRPLWRRMLPAGAAAAAAAGVTALAAWGLWPVPDVRPMARFDYVVPAAQQLAPTQRPVITVSPDARYFVYTATDGLYLRAMDALVAKRIPGTESAAGYQTNAFISPGGQWIGYFAGDGLRRIAAEGGASVLLCRTSTPYGASWTDDNTILFGQPSGIMRVSGDGGAPEVIVRAGDGEEIYGPQLLPGGDLVMFSVTTDKGVARWQHGQVVVHSLSSGKRTVILPAGSDARYLPTGHLVYTQGNTVFGVAFDIRRLTTSGATVPLVQGVQQAVGYTAVASNYAVSRDGILVYIPETGELRSFVWVNRKGDVERVATLPPGDYQEPRLSSDGRRLLATREGDLWIYEVATGRSTRLTHDGSSMMGVWSPDDSRVAYASARGGNLEAWMISSDGNGPPRQLTRLGGQVHVDSWSRDGRRLTLHHHRGSDPTGILILPMDRPEATPEPFVEPAANAEGAEFSRDGRHAAFLSMESGQREIYVRPYPGTGGQQIVSVGGGREALWAANGEIFYRSPSGDRMFVVPTSSGPPLHIGASAPLFGGQYFIAPTGSPRRQYDVTADGQRALMLTAGQAGSGGSRVVVVERWFDEVIRLMR